MYRGEIIKTKLLIPPVPPDFVSRPRLFERLDNGLFRKLTLVCTQAGYGKTALISQWSKRCNRPIAWLSLSEEDKTTTRFLWQAAASVAQVVPGFCDQLIKLLESLQPPSIQWSLNTFINEIIESTEDLVLIFDDYHRTASQAVDKAMEFILEHLPSDAHLVIISREEPGLSLARYRASNQLTELRTSDLRFTLSETTEFFSRTMQVNLSTEAVAALENRTEGWIAGLQLAGLAFQGRSGADTDGGIVEGIQAFAGSHRFVVDYLMQEVFHQQSVEVQDFLLASSILDRLNGSLCDAVVGCPSGQGQMILHYLEDHNLFVLPLDDKRHWYRYHHLFADLLEDRLSSSLAVTGELSLADYHIRASKWYADNGLELEAFQHAAAAGDFARVEGLISGARYVLQSGNTATIVLEWLRSLPGSVFQARPLLLAFLAMISLLLGRTSGVAEAISTLERAIGNIESEEQSRRLAGYIAIAKATLALTMYDTDTMLKESGLALHYLSEDDIAYRTSTYWITGLAHQFRGDFTEAIRAYSQVIETSHISSQLLQTILATIGMGQVQESDSQLRSAAKTYRQAVELSSDCPLPATSEAFLGLARVHYQWNDLETAVQYGERAHQLTMQYDESIDRSVLVLVFLSQVRCAQSNLAAADSLLTEAERLVRKRGFQHRSTEVAAGRVQFLLRQGRIEEAAQAAPQDVSEVSMVRVHLAMGKPTAARGILPALIRDYADKSGSKVLLHEKLLAALCWYAIDEKEQAFQMLGEILPVADQEGHIRVFVDEGKCMLELLQAAAAHGIMPSCVGRLISEFRLENPVDTPHISGQGIPKPLSSREMEVLKLVGGGLSNNEIGERLFIALDTVKGHNRKIFSKLMVKSRAAAIARAHELGLL